jgi:hypothetical protein
VADPVFGLIQLQAKPDARHAFFSPKADGPSAGKVRPSNWNERHDAPAFPVHTIGGGGGSLEWAAQPGALTEIFGDTLHRLQADLSHVYQVRMVAQVIVGGAASAKLRWQYSDDGGSGWSYLALSVAAPTIPINATGMIASAWYDIATGAKGDVLLRAVGLDG